MFACLYYVVSFVYCMNIGLRMRSWLMRFVVLIVYPVLASCVLV